MCKKKQKKYNIIQNPDKETSFLYLYQSIVELQEIYSLYFFCRASNEVCLSFCLDAKRSKRLRPRLLPDPIGVRKQKQKNIFDGVRYPFNEAVVKNKID